uniref:RING-type domain-containing protein n=1 Tax=Callorhinchus milii TaxID=7868 RepID=A0A4W3GZZ8_CALMI
RQMWEWGDLLKDLINQNGVNAVTGRDTHSINALSLKQFGPEKLWVNMASRHQVQRLTEEVNCAICLEFLNDPVSLDYGHNFCRSCITRSSKKQEENSCPECRQVTAERKLNVNWALAILVEKALLCRMKPNREKRFHKLR